MALKRLRQGLTRSLPSLLAIEAKRLFPGVTDGLLVRPHIGLLILTERCIFKCRICGVWREEAGPELTTKEWKGVIAELRKEGVRSLHLSGGEPLLRDDLDELVRCACTHRLDTTLLTNGFLLTEERARELVRAGVSAFGISVDAVGPAFDRIRGIEGGYAAVQRACGTLARLRGREGIESSIRITLSKPNLPYVADVLRMAESIDLPFSLTAVDFTPFIFRAARDEDLWIGESERKALEGIFDEVAAIKARKKRLVRMSYASLRYLRDYFKDPVQRKISCAKALMRIIIGPDGGFYGGCMSLGAYGNVRTTRIREIVRSPVFREAREKMFRKECAGCSCGYDLDLTYSLKCLLQEPVRAAASWWRHRV